MFCFFAHSVKLLPNGLFPKLLKRSGEKPDSAKRYFDGLFAAMESGGDFDLNEIAHFNGGLFDGRRAFELRSDEIGLLQAAASLDWSQIDPTIFGTLFERFLDPDKRAQIGAHYTDPGKIMMIIEPVILRPLHEEWATAKAEIEKLVTEAQVKRGRAFTNAMGKAEEARSKFIERLRKVTILDPACGSGNFLYLGLQGVKDIELKTNLECEALGLQPRAPIVGPEIVHGIEINPLAAELARTTIWIGDVQWRIRNGIYAKPAPILRKLDSIERRDAVIEKATSGDYVEAIWPKAEFIVGNPPYVGNKRMIEKLGEDYVTSLRSIYHDRISGGVYLVTYWFVKAWQMILSDSCKRAGLVATNSVRSGANRDALQQIVEQGSIFEAWADEEWTIDGADVRVSLVCFTKERELQTRLNGRSVNTIYADLTGRSFDITRSRALHENKNVSYVGVILNGEFEVQAKLAREWLLEPLNVNGRPNSEVMRLTFNGDDFNGNRDDKWVIDFGTRMSEEEAAKYERPFEFIAAHVKPYRKRLREDGSFAVRAKGEREIWWRHARARPAMRARLSSLSRYIATPMVSSPDYS